MSDHPSWGQEGRDWPNRAASHFVEAGGLRWHVQRLGKGPVLLLLHGTASATHSWRELAPLLARRFTVVAPDLPGHGFTALPPPGGLTLPGMATLVGALLRRLDLSPALVAGHSAGAAVLLRMALDGRIAPRAVIGLNAALLPIGRDHAAFFTGAARLLAGLPFVPRALAWLASERGVAERLLRDTGSRIGPRGVELYARLLRRPGHLRAALGMMAGWDLRPLLRDLPRLPMPLVLVVGEGDRTIPPGDALRLRSVLRTVEVVRLPGLGHLAHEERPEAVAAILERWAPVPEARKLDRCGLPEQ
ncbi:alpha/beta fold hydrolase BchO [Roseicella sp. DB1501]|uniref:alpha/beta fold hydrolase BchO n=1 Tax=Roseicella sp. DB1501 TaxID=2730925 RepID=UPI001491E108|nr:alpha/beta fold hydrolase [Roseicella sp. DB1501]